MSEIVYLDGKLLPVEQAHLAVLDHGFLYGDGLFETMRATRGVVFRCGEHLDRLSRGARSLHLQPLPSPMQFTEAIRATLQANRLDEAYVRLTVSRGPGAMSPDPATCGRPTVLVFARALPPPTVSGPEGARRAILARVRANAHSFLTGVKTLNYLPSIVARTEARQAGADEALLLNGEGWLTEATSSNLFLVEDGALITPVDRDGLLPGITRAVVMELASLLGMALQVRHVPPGELLCADEAFLTNSIAGILPLVALDGREIGAGTPGAVTRTLMSAYLELLTTEAS